MEITSIAPMTTVEIILPMERRLQPAWNNPPPMERRLQPAWNNPPPRKVPAEAGLEQSTTEEGAG